MSIVRIYPYTSVDFWAQYTRTPRLLTDELFGMILPPERPRSTFPALTTLTAGTGDILAAAKAARAEQAEQERRMLLEGFLA